jgi:hypothetical protein
MNEGATPDALLSPDGARVAVLVIAAREELVAARLARLCIG